MGPFLQVLAGIGVFLLIPVLCLLLRRWRLGEGVPWEDVIDGAVDADIDMHSSVDGGGDYHAHH